MTILQGALKSVLRNHIKAHIKAPIKAHRLIKTHGVLDGRRESFAKPIPKVYLKLLCYTTGSSSDTKLE